MVTGSGISGRLINLLAVRLAIYTLFHEIFWIFFGQYHQLAWTYKQKVKCFRNNKNVLFLYSKYKIIEQEMNKRAIHTHVIFRPRNAMFSLSNTYVFPDWQ